MTRGDSSLASRVRAYARSGGRAGVGRVSRCSSICISSGNPLCSANSNRRSRKAKRVVGVLRDASDRVGTRSDCGCKPLPGGIKVARSVPRQMCHDLQGHALAAAFAKLDHGFDGAKAAVGFDIRMIADSHRPASKADVERALGTGHDVFARSLRRQTCDTPSRRLPA